MEKTISYTKSQTDNSPSYQRISDEEQISSQYKLYRTCSDCPLDVFVKCLLESDYRCLIIEGNPTIEDINSAWNDIYVEYCDINSSNEFKYLLELQKSISLLSNELTVIESGLLLLQLSYSEELIKSLRKLDVDLELKPGEFDWNYQQLKMADAMLADRRLSLQMKESEYEEYMKARDTETIDKKYFNRMLMRLSRHRRVVTIRASEITVEEFVFMIEDFVTEQKHGQER